MPSNTIPDERGRALLAAYDSQLRDVAEVVGASRCDREGPLLRAVFEDSDDGAHGFVTYRSLTGYDGPDDGDALDALIARTIDHYRRMSEVGSFEWKTRGHDAPSDLGERLEAHGVHAQELETVMVGEAQLLASAVELPPGVEVRRVGVDADGALQPWARVHDDVVRTLSMQAAVFGSTGHESAGSLTHRLLEQPDRVELWIAETSDPTGAQVIVSAGRLEVVAGTEFAGIWGGATLSAWRGQGIYRALTAERARSALAKGVRYINSDCSPNSRPILARAGLVAITTTTPYVWQRPS